MRNCQRCKPCGGGHDYFPPFQPPIKPEKECGCGGSDVETIVEQPVYCKAPQRHHHKRVRHIVPIVYHQDHHHHQHHEYEIRRKHTQKHHHHEHGRFNGDWCETDCKNANTKDCEDSCFEHQCNGYDEQFYS